MSRISCFLFEDELKMLELIKKKGLSKEIITKPSLIIRIGLHIMSKLDIKEIYKNENNSTTLNNYYLKRMPSKTSQGKILTFILDEKSNKIMHEILNQAILNKTILTLSEIIRNSIRYVSQLNESTLQEHYQNLKKSIKK